MKPIVKTSERIIELMNIMEMTIPEMAKRTGLGRSSIWKYVNDKAEPRQDKIYIIASSCGVSPTWLLGYDVPMKIADNANAEYNPNIPGNTEIILEISRTIADLDKRQLELLLAYAYGLRDAVK